jgi:hypothetical protein
MRLHIALPAVLAALVVLAVGCTPTIPPASTGGSSAGTSSVAATGSAGTTDTSQMDSSNPDPAALLTIADVQSATGMTGLKLIAQDSTEQAVGRLNFANADGTLVAIMNIGDGVAFDQSLSGMNYARDATGTGDMSYVGPSPKLSPVLSIFAAAQGDHAVMMKTFLRVKDGAETWMSIDQLQKLVGLALSRWPS